MLRRLCVTLVLGTLLLAALVQGAAADPSGAKNSFAFTATCDSQQVDFVVNGNGDFTPGHVVDSTSVFVLQALAITFQFTPPGGPTETETFARSKRNPHGELVTCSFDVSEPSPEGVFRLFGTATGFFTPAA
jgi:hypothetical protein